MSGMSVTTLPLTHILSPTPLVCNNGVRLKVFTTLEPTYWFYSWVGWGGDVRVTK